MVGYLCATPFHITAAITLQSGQFAGKHSTLVILNHFGADEAFIERIRATGVFDEVILYDNNYRTLKDNIKRFSNAFFPVKLMKRLANKTNFTNFVCFALDFIDLTYIIKRYKKRGIECEFSFGDDGIGTYIREGIYKPKSVSERLLKLNGNSKYLSEVKKAYIYKPEYLVANRGYDITAILQDEQTCQKRRAAVGTIWPLDEEIAIDGNVLYFQQPSEEDKDATDLKIELECLEAAINTLGIGSAVKLHPRTDNFEDWEKFGIVKTRMPYEALMLQRQYKPAMLMTVGSTALFSTYLFDDLASSDCPSILLYKLMLHQSEVLTAAMNKLCDGINKGDGAELIFCPESAEELDKLLKNLAQNRKEA